MTVGEKIKLFRKESGISQQKLADMSGIARITIAQYEVNRFKPKPDTLKKLAQALKVPVQCFLSVEELLDTELEFLFTESVGRRIKTLRLCEGKTQAELATDIIINQNKESPSDNELTDDAISEISGLLDDYEHDFLSITEYQTYGGFLSQIAEALHVPDYIISSGLLKSSEIKIIGNSGYYRDLHEYINLLSADDREKVLEYAKDLSIKQKYLDLREDLAFYKKLLTPEGYQEYQKIRSSPPDFESEPIFKEIEDSTKIKKPDPADLEEE